MTDKPFVEHIRHVWFEHGNLFRSRIREEMDSDEEAMNRADDFEEAWRELYEYVLENANHETKEERRRRQIKERIKPLIHKKLTEKIEERR